MKRFIYQIGRYDGNYNQKLTFTYNGNTFQESLSSFALKKHFDDTEIILIYPVSIIYNKSAVNNLKQQNDPFTQTILNNFNSYLSNPRGILEKHPHNSQARDFIVIHSIGEYDKPDGSGRETFKGNYDDIVLEILCDLIERYLEISKEKNEFYFDVSSGHNIYISAMLEAIRHFSVFSQLINWLNKNLRPKIYITFSDPILGSSAQSFEIHIQELKFKALFSSPLNKDDVGEKTKLSKKFFPDVEDEDEEEKKKNRRKRKILDNFPIFFSALKNNTPLVLYHFEYDRYEEIIELLIEVIRDIKNKLSQNWLTSPKLPKDDYLKIILSLGFYAGIVEVLSDKGVKKCSDGVDLYEIKNKFGSSESSIYKIFGLETNIELLGNEIYNLESGYKVEGRILKEVVPKNWDKLKNYVRGEKDNFVQRNFIAHAGFERTITEIRKENDKLYFRYDSKEENVIKKALLEYIGG